jgi:dipeptidyl aminopeptidase/acylaminoacyl peptidase
MAVDGSAGRLVARFPHLPNGVPIAWSPDGSTLAFVSWRDQLWTVELSTGRRQLISSRRIETVSWAPSSQIAIGVLGPNRVNGFPQWSQVWTVDSDGTGARRITDQGFWIPAGWSPDASQLLVGRLDRRLRDHGLGLVSATAAAPQILNPDADAAFAAWRS